MSDLLTFLVFDFFGPAILVGLVIFGFVLLFRGVRLKKSLNAFKDNAEAQALEGLRVKAAVVRFCALIGGLIGFCLGFAMTDNIVLALFGMGIGYSPLNAWAGSMKQEYNAKFKKTLVAPELAKTFENLVYEPDRAFDAETLRDLKFFTPFSTVTGSDRITAEYKGVRFAQSDITLLEEGMGGGTQRVSREVALFNGRVMRFDFADSFSGPVQVVRRDFGEARVIRDRGEWQPVETELAEFGKDYLIFALDPLDAMRALTPQMVEGIYYLDKTLRVPQAFYFTGNSMYGFMALTRDAFDTSKKKTLLEERKFLEKDVTLVTDFLETMYFKTQEQTSETAADSAASGTVGNAAATASASDAPALAPLAVPPSETDASAELPPGDAGIAPVPPMPAASAPAAARRAQQERPANLATPTLGDTARRAGYKLGFVGNLLSRVALLAPLGFYLASAVYMLVEFSDGFALSYSSVGGVVTMSGEVSTWGYLLVGSIFIIPSSLAVGKAASDVVTNIFRGGGSGRSVDVRFKSILGNLFGVFMIALPFLLHLFYLNANVNYR